MRDPTPVWPFRAIVGHRLVTSSLDPAFIKLSRKRQPYAVLRRLRDMMTSRISFALSGSLCTAMLALAACSSDTPAPSTPTPSTAAPNSAQATTAPSAKPTNLVADAAVRQELLAAFTAFRSNAANTPGFAAIPPGGGRHHTGDAVLRARSGDWQLLGGGHLLRHESCEPNVGLCRLPRWRQRGSLHAIFRRTMAGQIRRCLPGRPPRRRCRRIGADRERISHVPKRGTG